MFRRRLVGLTVAAAATPRPSALPTSSSSGGTFSLLSHTSSFPAFSSASFSPVCLTSKRFEHTVTTAANFDLEVIQSQQAICAVYYIPSNNNCTAYLRSVERLVDELNAETADLSAENENDNDVEAAEEEVVVGEEEGEGVLVEEAAGHITSTQPEGTTIDVSFATQESGTATTPTAANSGTKKKGGRNGTKRSQWLKLCTINADENRNLASAFSVERAKLPMTYFVMQGTIIDKVVGHISEVRLRGILCNFLSHYQKQMNVDLMAKSSSRYGASGGSASPIPTAEKADLLQVGANAVFLKDKIISSLAGSEMIALPEEAAHLDGLRRLIQDSKKTAHAELQELYRQLGMDVRRLSDAEMHTYYYKSKQFTTMAVISALESLFLAREYAAIGDISRDNVEWARRAVQKDFEPILGNAELRKVLTLVEANLLKGDLQLQGRTMTIEMQSIVASLQAMQGGHASSSSPASADSSDVLKQRLQSLQEQLDLSNKLLSVLATHVDARVLEEVFPSSTVEDLFTDLKAALKASRAHHAAKHSKEPSSNNASRQGEQAVKGMDVETRVNALKRVILCVLQTYPNDAKSQMARSRLSSLLF